MEAEKMTLTPLEKFEKLRESMRKANEKYRKANREELNRKQNALYEINKTNEEYLRRARAKALAHYYRKKARAKALEDTALQEASVI